MRPPPHYSIQAEAAPAVTAALLTTAQDAASPTSLPRERCQDSGGAGLSNCCSLGFLLPQLLPGPPPRPAISHTSHSLTAKCLSQKMEYLLEDKIARPGGQQRQPGRDISASQVTKTS